MVRPLKQAITELEYDLIDEALTEADGNVKAAAQLLDINRSWLNRRIVTFEIDADAYRPHAAVKKKAKKKAKKKKSRAKRSKPKPGKTKKRPRR